MATPENEFRPSGSEIEAAHTEAKSVDLAQDLAKLGEQQVASGETAAGNDNLATAADVAQSVEDGKLMNEANIDQARASIASINAGETQPESAPTQPPQ